MPKLKKQQLNRGKFVIEPQGELPNSDKSYPVFSFRFLQSNFGINSCNGVQITSFVSKFHLISQLTWGDWKLTSRTGLGYEKIARNSIKAPIPSVITADIEYFQVFRFYDGRCVGYRDGIIFYIVWLDGSFKLYDH